MPKWNDGDLVWVRVHGYPVWPGQVMDESKALAMHKKSKTADKTVLVAFFGDDEWGWFDENGTGIQPLEHDLEKRSATALKPAKAKTPKGQHDKEHYKKAVEEVLEVRDRRAGREPLTDHNPTDFLTDSIDYLDVAAMTFNERVPEVSTDEAAQLRASDLVSTVRSYARNPSAIFAPEARAQLDLVHGLTLADRMVIRFRFDASVPETRSRTAKRATTAEGVEKAAARQAKEAAKSSKHKRKVAEARASSAAKSRASTGAGQDGADDDDYSDAPPAGKKRRTVGEAGDASADGKAAKKAAAAAKKGSKIAAAAMRAEDALRIGKPSGSKTSGSKTSGGKTSGKSSGNAEAADGAAADGAAEHALLAVVKGEEGEGKVPAGAGGGLRATDDCEPGAELPEGAKAWDIEVVEVGDPAEFAPTVFDIIPGLEEAVAAADWCFAQPAIVTVEPTPENGLADPREEQSAEVKNLKAKLKASKLAMRVRQLARNLKNPAVYSQVLNPHNLAGMFKWREAMRVLEHPEADREISSATRAILVDSWRERQSAILPAPPHNVPDGSPDLSTAPALCLHPYATVTLNIFHHLTFLSTSHENAAVKDVQRFWHKRGLAMELPIHHGMQLDLFELLREVAKRGGYWGCTAAQGRGTIVRAEDRLSSWSGLVAQCWTGREREVQPLQLAATLQAWYHFWLLPFEQHVMTVCAPQVARVHVPALLLRRLASERDTDSIILYVVKQLVPTAANEYAGAFLTGSAAQEVVSTLLVNKLGVQTIELLEGCFCDSHEAGADEKPLATHEHALRTRTADGTLATDATYMEDDVPLSSDDDYDLPVNNPRNVLGAGSSLKARSAHQKREKATAKAAAEAPRRKAAAPLLKDANAERLKEIRVQLGDVPVHSSGKVAKGEPGVKAEPAAGKAGASLKDGTRASGAAGGKRKVEAPPPVEKVNPFKRQPVGSAGGGSRYREHEGPSCIQVHFDPQYRLPDVTDVEKIVCSKYELQDTSLEPTRMHAHLKMMIIFLRYADDARRLERDLPNLLRLKLQLHEDYYIDVTCISKSTADDKIPRGRGDRGYRGPINTASRPSSMAADRGGSGGWKSESANTWGQAPVALAPSADAQTGGSGGWGGYGQGASHAGASHAGGHSNGAAAPAAMALDPRGGHGAHGGAAHGSGAHTSGVHSSVVHSSSAQHAPIAYGTRQPVIILDHHTLQPSHAVHGGLHLPHSSHSAHLPATSSAAGAAAATAAHTLGGPAHTLGAVSMPAAAPVLAPTDFLGGAVFGGAALSSGLQQQPQQPGGSGLGGSVGSGGTAAAAPIAFGQLDLSAILKSAGLGMGLPTAGLGGAAAPASSAALPIASTAAASSDIGSSMLNLLQQLGTSSKGPAATGE